MDRGAVYRLRHYADTRQAAKEIRMDELLNDLLTLVISIKEKAREENISIDDYETMIIDTLNSAGVECSR